MLAKAETKERRQKKLEQVRLSFSLCRVCTFMNAYAASLSKRWINISESNDSNSLIDEKGKGEYKSLRTRLHDFRNSSFFTPSDKYI